MLELAGQKYYITSIYTPGNCFGGTACAIQPMLQISNSQGQVILDFKGSCYVQMLSSPSGYEPLYIADPAIGACDASGYCGKKVLGTLASVPFVNGLATFNVRSIINLTIKIR